MAVKIAYFTTEYLNVVSGNGVLARVQVVVFTPETACGSSTRGTDREEDETHDGHVCIERITWPSDQSHLLRHGHWETYVEGCLKTYLRLRERFDLLMGVDWTGMAAALEIKHRFLEKMPIIFLPFRVFSNSPELCTTPEDHSFYFSREVDGLFGADFVVSLSPSDAAQLAAMPPNMLDSQNSTILLPPLRREFELISRKNEDETEFAQRRHVLCCVRLSPEKGALTCIESLISLKQFLTQRNVVPVLCGQATDQEYGEQVRQLVRNNFPDAIIYDSMLASEQLAEVLSKTCLNIHPARRDAYGMTIIEAAACATPSIITNDDSVGAWYLLRGSFEHVDAVAEKTALLADVSQPETLAIAIKSALDDMTQLWNIGQAAKRVATSWSEIEYQKQLGQIVKETCELS